MPLWPVALALVLVSACEQENEYVAAPPPPVSVAQPLQRDVIEYLEFTGTTAAAAFVEVRARVPGVLDDILFLPGDRVEEGQILFVIDDSEYEATLQAAKADLNVAKAELAQATTELDRSERLKKKGAVAEVKVVEWQTKRNVAQAEKQRALATVDRALLDLSYTAIQAPIQGRVSRNVVDLGNLVGEGEATLLATITDYDPMYVYFNLNELDLLRVMKMVRERAKKKGVDFQSASPDAKPEIPLHLGLADEEGYPHEGVVDYGESGVDPETGTLQLRGVFANPGMRPTLLPGFFARLRMPVQQRENALLVTERAVGADQGGRYVLVVVDDNVVEKRTVRMGQNVDGLLVVEEGLQAGERVVVKGMQRARPGAPVDPQPIEMESFTTSAIRAAAAEAAAGSAQASEGDTAVAREDEEPAPGAATD